MLEKEIDNTRGNRTVKKILSYITNNNTKTQREGERGEKRERGRGRGGREKREREYRSGYSSLQ